MFEIGIEKLSNKIGIMVVTTAGYVTITENTETQVVCFGICRDLLANLGK